MYIPLRAFTPFSIGFGAVKPAAIVDWCIEHDVPACGFADRDSLSGALTVCKELVAKGVQPIVGATVTVRHGDIHGDLVLFACSHVGYEAVMRMVNRWNLADSPKPPSLVEAEELLAAGAGDVIALTGGPEGLLEKVIAADGDGAAVLACLATCFAGRLYVEIQRPDGRPSVVEGQLAELAAAMEVPIVATNEAHYASVDMVDAHDAFLCIADRTYIASADRRRSSAGRHLVEPSEMIARFADIPEALENTTEIARRAAFTLEPSAPRLPAFPTPEGVDEQDHLRSSASAGLLRRLEEAGDLPAARRDYDLRLEYELDVIVKMGFSGYFLIVADYIAWARAQGIPVGPGRGSGAGSLVAWALGITDIDPLAFGLLFERFLNPERVSMPDFDIDFCQERREEVIDYVRQRYGPDRVAHIAAFGTLQARAVVRDVGRVMQIAYPVVDRYAKMIPANPSNPLTLAEAMEEGALCEELASADEDIQILFATALKLEGLYRHVSTHAAGVIISDRPVHELVPVHRDGAGKLSTSFEMKAAEQAGLVKFDFLGLKNLDIIRGAVEFVERTTGEQIEIDRLDYDDPETFQQLARGDGFAVFQLESSGMRQAMREVGIANIEELIALISLYRPGPMDQIPTYVDVKRGDREVTYADAETREVLEPTNGVMIYQEQVMEIARRLAGYTLGDADLLRRAMGKKIQSEMDAQRERFTNGAAAGWVDVTLETGETRRMHALAKVPLADGSGRMIPLSEAMHDELEVVI